MTDDLPISDGDKESSFRPTRKQYFRFELREIANLGNVARALPREAFESLVFAHPSVPQQDNHGYNRLKLPNGVPRAPTGTDGNRFDRE